MKNRTIKTWCVLVVVAFLFTIITGMTVQANAETQAKTINKIKVVSEGIVDRSTGYIHYTIEGEGFTEYNRNEYASTQSNQQVKYSADVILVANDGYVFDKGWTLLNERGSKLNAYLYRVYDDLFEGITEEVYSGEPEVEVGKVAVIKVSGEHNQPIGVEEAGVIFDEDNTPELQTHEGRRPSTPVATNPPADQTGTQQLTVEQQPVATQQPTVPVQPTEPTQPQVTPVPQYHWETHDDGVYFTNGVQNWTGWLYAANNTVYFFGLDGRMVKGWINIESQDYYLSKTENFTAGWYYFGENGSMVRGFNFIDGYTYFFEENGVMHTSWYVDDDNNVYYFHKVPANVVVVSYDEDGTAQWERKDVPAGSMATNQWLRFVKNGGYINYYMQEDGTMARDQTIGEYYVDEYGRNYADSIVIR